LIKRVVDTNVAIVANGRDTHASDDCQLSCIQLLEDLVKSGCVVIDDRSLIIEEYSNQLRPQGQPGVGDRFYRHVLDNQGTERKLKQVTIDAQRGDALREAFKNGELSNFDRSDRVFALCSVIGRAPIATATDSDWHDHHNGLCACGVQVHFVCGHHVARAGGHER
jgi:hypothetical protein